MNERHTDSILVFDFLVSMSKSQSGYLSVYLSIPPSIHPSTKYLYAIYLASYESKYSLNKYYSLNTIPPNEECVFLHWPCFCPVLLVPISVNGSRKPEIYIFPQPNLVLLFIQLPIISIIMTDIIELLLHERNTSKFFACHWLIYSSQLYEMEYRSSLLPKGRAHAAGKWWTQNPYPGSLAPEPLPRTSTPLRKCYFYFIYWKSV